MEDAGGNSGKVGALGSCPNLAGAGTGGRGCLLERGYGERSNCYSLDLLEFDYRGGRCFCFYVCCCISALGWKVHTLCEDLVGDR